MGHMRKLGRSIAVGVVAVVGIGGLAACSSSSDSASNEVTVTMSEFNLKAKPDSVGAGEVKIVADNVGGEKHELVVVRGTEPLPTKADGSVDEKGVEDRIVGEVEGVAAQSQKSKTFKLTKGDYTLICNIVSKNSDGSVDSHYDKGMKTSLTVD